MTTHTSNTPAPGTSPGGTPTHELPSVGFQETDHTRAVTTNVEADFLRETFGVSVPHDAVDNGYAERLSQEVARRVLTVIDGTRNALTFAELHTLLNPTITQRLQSIAIDTHHNHALAVRDTLHSRRVRAVLEAIRESLPAAVMNDVIRYGVPAFVSKDVDQPAHKVVLQNVTITSPHPYSGAAIGPCTVEIDTRYDLWRNTDPTALRAELERQIDAKRTLKTLGIRIIAVPPVPESFVLTKADLPAILDGEAEGIDLWKRYEVMQHRSAITGITGLPEVRFTVDTAKLVRHRIKDPNSPGNIILVGDIASAADLQNAFLGNTDNILNFITTIPPNALENTPAHPRPVQVDGALNEVAQRLFTEGTLPAVALNTLTAIQTEIHEQHRFFENMRKGSDNHMAAALATKLVMEHKDLRDVLVTRNETDIKKNLKDAQENVQLLKLIEDLESATVPGGGGTWEGMDTKEIKIGSEETRLATLTAPSILMIGTGPLRETFSVVQDKSGSIDASRVEAQAWLFQKREEIRTRKVEYRTLESKIRAILLELERRSISVPSITSLIPSGKKAAKTDQFSSTMNIRALAEDVRISTSMVGKNRDALLKDVQKYQKELDAGGAKDVTGAEAQHKVITAELMRYHGLTDNEAHEGANVLRARALLDTDMSVATQRIADEQFGHDAHQSKGDTFVSGLESLQRADVGVTGNLLDLTLRPTFGTRDLQIIRNIAKECHIPLPSNANQKPLWAQSEKYEDLLTAYHSLKKVRFQKYYDRNSDVPWDVRIRSTARLDQDMREISRALFLFHAKGLLQEYGPSVGLKDGDAEKILAEPTKSEHERILRQIIEGAPNAEVASRMGHVIEHAAKRTQPAQRFLSSTLFGKNWGIVTGGKLPFSYRAVLYGNKNWSLRGGWNFMRKLTHNVNNNPKALLWGAVATGLTFNPLAGVAASAYTWKAPPPMTQASDQGGGGTSHGNH